MESYGKVPRTQVLGCLPIFIPIWSIIFEGILLKNDYLGQKRDIFLLTY
jgi:hypothetical protein